MTTPIPLITPPPPGLFQIFATFLLLINETIDCKAEAVPVDVRSGLLAALTYHSRFAQW